ncbi:MAG: VWA domain-containing protein [Desulfobacteraceae bacterium]|nr:VWA domain-containing protein [Desulfobacteraceae bacterium]
MKRSGTFLPISERRENIRRQAAHAVRDAGVPPAVWEEQADRLARRAPAAADAFLAGTADAVCHWSPDRVALWGRQALEALEGEEAPMPAGIVRAYLRASVQLHREIPLDRWPELLALGRRIAAVSEPAAEAFLRYGVRLCRQLTAGESLQWVQEGLRRGPGRALLLAWFNGTSPEALRHRDILRKSVLLEDSLPVLSLMVQAFCGRAVPIQSGKTLNGLAGYTGGGATDGRAVYLPETAPDRARFQLAALHQAVLMERIAQEPGVAWMETMPERAHAAADRVMARRLPGMKRRMRESDGSPPGYPDRGAPLPQEPLPWWGELLPDLVRTTDAAVRTVRERAAADSELSPEMIESLTAALLARGHRDGDEIWALLQQMDRTQFASPGPEDLPPEIVTRTWPEWDIFAAGYRRNWCCVRELPGDESPNDFVERQRQRHAGLIRLIRRRFLRLKPEALLKRKAQSAGDDLDPDALITAVIDRRARSELTENVYIQRRINRRDVATMFLLDISASSGEKAGGRRVIDIQREALVLLSSALEALGDRYAVYGFRSEGRHRVDMVAVKSFAEPFGEACAARIGNLEPGGFTRLGAGIRHAAHLLEAVTARVRLLMILTDGRPYDYEYGDLDYAVADTRNAADALQPSRIHPFVITSDREGADYLERMVPGAASVILPRVERLPDLLPRLYRRLTM